MYAGKHLYPLRGSLPSEIDIHDGSTLHLMPIEQGKISPWYRPSTFELDSFIEQSRGRLCVIKKLAAEYGFDDETHIVEPEAHSGWLAGLEKYVLRNSEFKMVSGQYDATNENFGFYGSVNIPDYMVPFVRLVTSVSKSVAPEAMMTSESQLKSLLKSYLILTRILQTLNNLVDQGFASSYYSFLLERPSHNVAELIAIERSFLLALKQKLEASIQMLADDQNFWEWSSEIRESLSDCLLPVLMSFLGSLCNEASQIQPTSDDYLSRLCRVTILLCDLALVSYVGSHGSTFNEQLSTLEKPRHFAISSKSAGVYSFRCDLRRLTCLDGLLDSKQVWVFSLNLENGVNLFERPPNLDNRLSIVTTMEKLADIWGPVRALFSADDQSKIIQYNISKGVVRRSSSKNADNYKSAIACHWEDWSSHYGRAVSSFRRLILPSNSSLLLSPGDLLLIGEEGYQPNSACTYTLSAFKADYEHQLECLGTKPAEWKSDTRNAVISFSKIIGMSLGLTQKRIPQTTVKQYTWDTWTSQTKRQNPMILQRFSGIEISHCTGNANKIPLKTFFQQGTLIPQSDLQFPGWRTSSWGRRFLGALDMASTESFLHYWKSNESDREHVTELIVYFLHLLSGTGVSDGKLKAFLAQDGEEYIVPMDIKKNSWAAILKDTHLTAVYVAIQSSCMECSPMSLRSSCSQCVANSNSTQSHTVLHFQAEISSLGDCDYVVHDVSGKVFKVIQAESTEEALVLTTATSRHSSQRLAEKKGALDNNDDNRQFYVRNIYIKSNAKSFGGMMSPRSSLRHLRGTRELTNAVQQSRSFCNIGTPAGIAVGDDSHDVNADIAALAAIDASNHT